MSELHVLGLKAEDDKGGVILKSLHMLEGFWLTRIPPKPLIEAPEVRSAGILIREGNALDPDLIAAHLAAPIAKETFKWQPELIAQAFSLPVSTTLYDMHSLSRLSKDRPNQYAELMGSPDEPGNPLSLVKKSFLATGIFELEEAMRLYGKKDFADKVVFLVEKNNEEVLQRIPMLQALRDIHLKQAEKAELIIGTTDETRLEQKFSKALDALTLKIASAPSLQTSLPKKTPGGFKPG